MAAGLMHKCIVRVQVITCPSAGGPASWPQPSRRASSTFDHKPEVIRAMQLDESPCWLHGLLGTHRPPVWRQSRLRGFCGGAGAQ